MNKRIEKKVAKRHAEEAEEAVANEASAAGPHAAMARVRETVAQVEQSLRAGKPREAVRVVQESAGEAIDQVRAQVKGKIAETEQRAEALFRKKETQLKEKLGATEQRVKEKLEQTEQRAEELLEKVPVVGPAAAKKLHEITHR